MSSTFYQGLFKETLHDLSHEPMQWYGVVANPAAANVVPLVPSEALGLVPSPTFARQLVLATTDAILVIDFDRENPEADFSYRDEEKLDYAGELDAVVRSAPAPVIAAVAVALQRLAVDIGREWIDGGCPAGRLRTLWNGPAHMEDTSASDWVLDRWDRGLAASDASLSPTRLLGRSRADLRELVGDLNSRICKVTLAAFDECDYRFRCLIDPAAPAIASEAPTSTLTPDNDHWGETPPLQASVPEPWASAQVGVGEEPPF